MTNIFDIITQLIFYNEIQNINIELNGKIELSNFEMFL